MKGTIKKLQIQFNYLHMGIRCLFYFALAIFTVACSAEPVNIIYKPQDGLVLADKNGEKYLELGYYAWGPNWSNVETEETVSVSGTKSSYEYLNKIGKTDTIFHLRGNIKEENSSLVIDSEITSQKNSDLQLIQYRLRLGSAFERGSFNVYNGEEWKEKHLPLGRGPLGENIEKIIFADKNGEKTEIEFFQPMVIYMDNELRIALVEKEIKKNNQYKFGAKIRFKSGIQFVANAETKSEDSSNWYLFSGTLPYKNKSYISLKNWNHTVINDGERIAWEGDKFVVSGAPIKLWGINYNFGDTAPEKHVSDKRVKTLRDLGINSVRLHKYAEGHGWSGIMSEKSAVKFNLERLDRFDYFVSKLKSNGIYTALSPVFIFDLGEDDLVDVPYLKEFSKYDKHYKRHQATHGSIYFSEALQNLLFKQAKLTLNHTNPYTQKKYSEESSIAYYELYNEDSSLFYGTSRTLEKSETIRNLASELFSAWLMKKYSSVAGWKSAWSDNQLGADFLPNSMENESFSEKRVYPYTNPWYMDPDNLHRSQSKYRVRILDTMQFLIDLQNDFYKKYVAEVRSTGYDGVIIASNWKAGKAYSHYLNLHSDYLVGPIDRHNYYGGLEKDKFKIQNASMLSRPGSGILSSGLHQVVDRPFILSEWIHVFPNEWIGEGAAIISAYGMGLQGWDASYVFNTNRDRGQYTSYWGASEWDPMVPQFIGLFPAVSRQVLRGDVAESEVVHLRNVSVDEIREGKLGFKDQVTASWDTNEYTTDVFPAEMMAVARSVVKFDSQETTKFDASDYVDSNGYRSTTGELRWVKGSSRQDGYFAINTAATQALVGFAKSKPIELKNFDISTTNEFSMIYATALGENETIESGVQKNGILISAIARAHNKGMKIVGNEYLESRGQSSESDNSVIVMEPVKFKLKIKGLGKVSIHILDQNGELTGEEIPLGSDNTASIDTGKYLSPYYLIK